MFSSQFFCALDDAQAVRVLEGEEAPPLSVDDWVLDPAVQLGLLEAELTGSDVADVFAQQHWARRVCVPVSKGGPVVFSLPDGLRDALAVAPDARVALVTRSWSLHEEMEDYDPEVLGAFVSAMVALSRRAVFDTHHLYCLLGA